MGIKDVLFKINCLRKDLNVLYSVDKIKRNIEWQEKVQVLKNCYKTKEFLNKYQYDNLIYNNKKRYSSNILYN